MKTIQLRSAALVLPDRILENASVLIENGVIAEISEGSAAADQVFELGDQTVFAGFIDVHIHGAVGVDTNTASVEELQKAAAFLASKGTTAWLPTFVPDSDETYRQRIGAINELMKMQGELPVAQAIGVHYEGVFANTQMCGALRPEYFKTFTGGEVTQLPRLDKGVHLTTFAPEVEGGIELVRELRRQNWIPSIGHTKADFETLEKAFAAGASHLTHFFNAMTGLHHRDIGVVGWALGRPEVTCDVIADGIHVNPKVLELAYRLKTAENLMLISDAVAPTGLGDGQYELWGERISVTGGRTQNERGSIAGSVITMLDGVRRFLSLGVPAWDVSRMASANPARLLGLTDQRGTIEVGKRADLVALDADGNVTLCLVAGDVAFDNLEPTTAGDQKNSAKN